MRTKKLLQKNGGRSAVLSMKNKSVAAMADKMKQVTINDDNSNNRANLPSANELSPIVRETMQSIQDAENVRNVLPDIDYAAEIRIASILSTKDLVTTSLIYESLSTELNTDMKSKMVKLVRDYFSKDFKLQDKLKDILYDVDFVSGSYPVCIIPEAGIDKLLKSRTDIGNEKFIHHTNSFLSEATKTLGLLGSTSLVDSVGTESNGSYNSTAIAFDNDGEGFSFDSIKLLDNPSVLRIPSINSALSDAAVEAAYNLPIDTLFNTVGNESIYSTIRHNGTDGVGDNKILSRARTLEIPTPESVGRPSIGHPLWYHLPSESVIPIHTPGKPKEHVAYLVILDGKCNPISRHDLVNYNLAWSWINGDASSDIKESVAQGLGLKTRDIQAEMTISNLTNSFANIVENQVKMSLNKGTYSDNIEMCRPEEVYRIILGRLLAKQGTQMLFIPAQQMIYYAMDYNHYGVGVSLLEKTRMISTIRTALQFASLNGNILNCTRNQQYEIELDPNDREPEKTIQDEKYRIMQSFNSMFPFTGTPTDMWSYMANAGISFSNTGNDFYPGTKINVSDNSPDYKVPDKDFMDDVAKQQYRGFLLDPELILNAQDIEFASQVTSKNLLQTRMICVSQDKLNPNITKTVKVYTKSDGTLLSGLAEIAKEYHDAKLGEGIIGKQVREFIESLHVSLPRPDSGYMKSQLEAFDDYLESVDKVLESGIFTPDIEGVDVDRTKTNYKSYLALTWLRENDVAPEVIGILDDIESYSEFTQLVSEASARSVALTVMLQKAQDKRVQAILDKLQVNSEESSEYQSDNEYGDDTSGFDSSTDDEDDFNMSFDDEEPDSGDVEDNDETEDDGDTTEDTDTDKKEDTNKEDNLGF